KNKSLIGWIEIADTIIDYPVMQTVDNDYYLKHDFNQKNDANGCIFLDCNCDVILGNDNWILYGHHMKNGKMFSSLIKYADMDYYEKHKYIRFDTIYVKGTYEVMYAFRSRIYNSNEITFKYYQFIDANSSEEFNSYMEEMEKMSLIDTGVSATYGDRLLTLSTCDYQEENGRFVVVAKRID
ncbi:MAG: class B sortase, partial [Lachnospiraceae bacterium]|nr:class B sortase [Lachnospiraceae bacterium]